MSKEREPFTFPFTPLEAAQHHIEHQHLVSIMRCLPSDFEPWGQRSRDTASMTEPIPADCSMGCVFYKNLTEPLGGDWGICTNPVSPRCGLLTFEHQGCPQFVSECIDDDCVTTKTLADHLRETARTCWFYCPDCGARRESLKTVADERCHEHGTKQRRFTQMVQE